MTTIAIDKYGTIAADRLAANGWGGVVGLTCRKIAVTDGKVYATSGFAALFDPLIEWHKNGSDPKNTPVVVGNDAKWSFLVYEDGHWYLYTSETPYRDPVELPYSLGSGCDYALGAMYAGASAKEAVEIACRLDTRSGGEIQVVNISEALGLQTVREAAE